MNSLPTGGEEKKENLFRSSVLPTLKTSSCSAQVWVCPPAPSPAARALQNRPASWWTRELRRASDFLLRRADFVLNRKARDPRNGIHHPLPAAVNKVLICRELRFSRWPSALLAEQGESREIRSTIHLNHLNLQLRPHDLFPRNAS